MVGMWHVQLTALWHWHLPSCIYKVPRVFTGAYKYLQIEFAKKGVTSLYICITVLTSLANTKNAHG